MITYGFYDSLNHDRRYNAIQFGSIFDGVIRDGIFMSIGTCFRVIPGEGMMLLVGIGRAWFNHTWTLNDAPLPIYIPQSEVLLNRIDAIVLDIYSDQAHRVNDVIVVKGTPSKTPQRPTLINTTHRHQYPLAYISVGAGVTSIRAADITSMIGTSSTPYVTGILETVNIDALLDQWQDQWNVFFEKQTAEIESNNAFWKREWQQWYEAQTEEIQNAYLSWEAQWDAWYESQTGMMKDTADQWKNLWNAWFYSYTNQSEAGLDVWIDNTETDFMTWWQSIQAILDESCCANLAQRIVELEKQNDELEEFRDALINKREVYSPIYDTRYDKLIAELTNHDNVEITNDQGEPIDLIGENTEPILDNSRKEILSTMKIAVV